MSNDNGRIRNDIAQAKALRRGYVEAASDASRELRAAQSDRNRAPADPTRSLEHLRECARRADRAQRDLDRALKEMRNMDVRIDGLEKALR